MTARSRIGVLTVAITAVALVGACSLPESATEPTRVPDAATAARATAQVRDLESAHHARVGAFAVDTKTGVFLGYRENERFPIGSTFKTLAVAALLRDHPLADGYFDTVIHFTADDLVKYSPVTETRVDSGMTVRELAAAAIEKSDNTATNELLKLLGGPTAITKFVRTLGDTVTSLDDWEPLSNSGDTNPEHNSTTAAALAADYRALVSGDALPAPERAQLIEWLLRSTTGLNRIRAGLPQDWKTGDKTGGGDYGLTNDAAVTWPPASDSPIVITVLSINTEEHAPADDPLVARSARAIVEALHPAANG
ncbi:class A beta-lactamase [Nocardia sp. NPDC052316]|uniref:class A beta-lactamase n=1 Tax=Nocardia sp. NPDC052316 TaxID=3364329 RepID=UPI0037C8214A